MCVYMCVSACLCVSACVCVTHTSAHVLSAHHPLACTGQDNFIVVQTHEGFTIRALDARPALNVNLRSVEQVLPRCCPSCKTLAHIHTHTHTGTHRHTHTHVHTQRCTHTRTRTHKYIAAIAGLRVCVSNSRHEQGEADCRWGHSSATLQVALHVTFHPDTPCHFLLQRAD